MNDQQLLREFVDRRDERAFAAIVERYLPVVHAAARRQVHGDTHLAEDVTQAVFIMLAQKASSLRDGTLVAGWLVNAARLAAKSAAGRNATQTTGTAGGRYELPATAATDR